MQITNKYFTKLKLNDIVILKNIPYKVCESYLENMRESGKGNGEIFDLLGLDKQVFCAKWYGYETSHGEWPDCNPRDYQALARVVRELFDAIGHSPKNIKELYLDLIKR